MNLFDLYAAAALSGICGHINGPDKLTGETGAQAHARWASNVAIEMLKQRKLNEDVIAGLGGHSDPTSVARMVELATRYFGDTQDPKLNQTVETGSYLDIQLRDLGQRSEGAV